MGCLTCVRTHVRCGSTLYTHRHTLSGRCVTSADTAYRIMYIDRDLSSKPVDGPRVLCGVKGHNSLTIICARAPSGCQAARRAESEVALYIYDTLYEHPTSERRRQELTRNGPGRGRGDDLDLDTFKTHVLFLCSGHNTVPEVRHRASCSTDWQ